MATMLLAACAPAAAPVQPTTAPAATAVPVQPTTALAATAAPVQPTTTPGEIPQSGDLCEGTGGDPLDGRFSFGVVGNQNHAVRVFDGQFNYPKTMFFTKGVQKIINVEPGTAVYN